MLVLGDITAVAPVNEHLGCKSVSATTKAALDGTTQICKTTSAFLFLIINH